MTAVHHLLNVALKEVRARIVERSDCPAHIVELIAAKEKELLALDFVFSHCLAINGMSVKEYPVIYQFFYLHKAGNTFAQLSISPTADATMPCNLSFKSRLPGNQMIITYNGERHLYVGDFPITVKAFDSYAESTEAQLAFHMRKVQEKGLASLNLDESIEIREAAWDTERFYNDYLQKLQKEGAIYRKDNFWAIRLPAALKFAFRRLSGEKKLSSLKYKLRKRKSTLVGIPVEVEVKNYLNISRPGVGPSFNAEGKALFMAAMMALFIGAFSLYLPLKLAIMILFVILVHEGGHLLAMHLTGYTNLSMLLIPLFGGVAMGSSRNVASYKKMIVLFAGPLPGIIFAAVCAFILLHSGYKINSDAMVFLALLAIINYLNLLPFLPLDGGFIFNLAIFSRMAYLQAGFILLSVAALVTLGLYLKWMVMIIVAALIAIATGHSMRQYRLLASVKNAVGQAVPQDEEQAATAIFREMQKGPMAGLPFALKYDLVRHCDNNLVAGNVSVATTVASVAAYVFIVFLPVYFYYWTPLKFLWLRQY
jgi:Zn-dependent protease